MRRNLLEQFEPLRTNRILKRDKSSGVAAWLGQTGNEACTDRVNHSHENDWYTLGGSLQSSQSKARWRNQDIGYFFNQFGSLACVAIGIIRAPADIELNVAAFDPA